MSKDLIVQLDSISPQATEKLGQLLGSKLRGGEVIELRGDLGGGKTTFVRGVARGVGSKDHVASPSFTISRVYKSGKVTLHHMDFYRLDEAGIMELQIDELISDRENAVIIEWADVTKGVLPDERLVINFINSKDEKRVIEFVCPPQLDYLLKDFS